MDDTKCAFCGQAGKHGAQWIIRVSGMVSNRQIFDGKKFHRPCADSVIKQAPVGLKSSIQPSAELISEWKEKARLKRVREFWEKNTPKLKELRDKLPALPAAAA